MYLRLSRQKRADGSILAHLQIAENVWDPEKKRSQARIIYNCGRADDTAVTERLKRLAHSILRRCSPEDIVASQSNWRLLDAWPYGDVYVLEKIWHRLGIDEVIAEVLGKRKFDFPVEQVKHDLKGWRLGRCVFVGDAGMVSKDNLKKLALGGGRYIVCMPVHAGGEVDREVVSRPGRYRPVAENLKVKEVVVGDGERRRRYVVCHNPSEAERKRRHRAVVLGELATELESLREDNEPGHSKRVCALRASARYGRYVRLTRTGQPRNDRAKIKGRRTSGRQVRGARQRRFLECRGFGARLQATAAGGGSVAAPEERAEVAAGLSLRTAADPGPCGALGAGPVARAGRRARLRRHLAEHS